MDLISEETFNNLYHLLYTFIFLIVLAATLQIDIKPNNSVVNFFLQPIFILFVCISIILVGFRAYNVGTDTGNYYLFSWINNYNSTGTEKLFDWLIQLIKYIGGSFTLFLLLIAYLFFTLLSKAYQLIGHYYNTSSLFIFFILMSLFFSKSLSINVIRQGLALSLLVYAYAIWINIKKLKLSLIFLILAFICHTTSILPTIIFILIQYKLKNISVKYFALLYILGIILAATNFGLLNVAPFLKDILQDDRRADYLNNNISSYVVGFKAQFVLFNTVFACLFYFISGKLKVNIEGLKVNYDNLLKYFFITSFLFFMAFQMPYSDRWGVFCWIAIPILSCPLFSFTNFTRTYKSTWVLFFGFIYLFFTFYES